ncbi:hypothetical protein ACO0K9_11700 [Undibacterium sp. Ji50W]|uniref:hypothetical protein n=1 Tax=Undibacterium sp. Ji50W TaxID=3413041 RepID=UPI003BF10AE4
MLKKLHCFMQLFFNAMGQVDFFPFRKICLVIEILWQSQTSKPWHRLPFKEPKACCKSPAEIGRVDIFLRQPKGILHFP